MYLSRQEKYFPNPDEYIPDRWMKGENEKYTSKEAHPFAYMPFGFGPRSCIGKRFAQLEMEILLAKVFDRRGWKFCEPWEKVISWASKYLQKRIFLSKNHVFIGTNNDKRLKYFPY